MIYKATERQIVEEVAFSEVNTVLGRGLATDVHLTEKLFVLGYHADL